ncbi:hypothetical protein Ga0080574_TMP1999 [Salipiger abyssi]|uniref:Uncharacterized protein n=1 Tax=Salipiger abyssi TaxID=1250539 RepID=A0A1P8USE3_9RHOB|nr:hypothetical protein Ga0080574_TMP1999 [Salipiger abyssi]
MPAPRGQASGRGGQILSKGFANFFEEICLPAAPDFVITGLEAPRLADHLL